MIDKGYSHDRAEIIVDSRLLLRVSTFLEYWGLFLARWLNVAAHAGRSMVGVAGDLMRSCEGGLDPKPWALLRRWKKDGFTRRRDINRMVGQCVRWHNLWAQLAPSGVAHLAEFNGQGGTPCLCGELRQRRVARGHADIARGPGEAEQIAAIKNGHGHTPLQTAIIHSEVEAVAVLAGYTGRINHASNVRLVRQTAATSRRCEELMRALRVSDDKTERSAARCDASARSAPTSAARRAAAEGGGGRAGTARPRESGRRPPALRL